MLCRNALQHTPQFPFAVPSSDKNATITEIFKVRFTVLSSVYLGQVGSKHCAIFEEQTVFLTTGSEAEDGCLLLFS